MQQTTEIRRLNTCTFDEAVQIWNEGFKGYLVDMTVSLDAYLRRFQGDGLSTEHSFIAFRNGKPAGFLLNAIRTNGGQRVAWNGGTGVSPEFRGQGVGRILVEAALALYAEEGVELATLEALTSNEVAISLYQKCGYEIIDRLVFLEHHGSLRKSFSGQRDVASYAVRLVSSAAVAGLAFYNPCVPWQGQWQSLLINGGGGLIVSDARGDDVGYALYKRIFDEEGRATIVYLYQCAAAPGHQNAETIVARALEEVFSTLDLECRTHNLSKKNELVCQLLDEAGFTTFVEQVHMARTF